MYDSADLGKPHGHLVIFLTDGAMAVQQQIFLIIAICVQFAALQSRRRLEEGDHCKLENRQRGVCRLLNDCPTAIKELAENQKWPLTCVQKPDGTSIICCDEGSSAPTSPPTRRPPRPTTPIQVATTSTTPKPITTPRSQSPRPQKYTPGIISRQKCDEYSRWISKPTVFITDKDVRVPGECADVAQFIVGGKEAEPLEFPHMAHLGFGEDFDQLSWSCGGSLISEQYVLTAAHCLRKKDGTNVTHARLGSSDPPSTQIIPISEVIPHPQYTTKQFYNDIALLKLAKKVMFNDYRRPACIQVNRYFGEKNGTASGWGVTEAGKGSKKLLKVSIPFMGTKECRNIYKVNPYNLPNGIDDKTQVCAGALDLQKDTCQGDSGGPLQILLKNPACMYSLVGITSFGSKCGRAPGVYTRVSGFVPWIESHVWPSANAN